MPDSKTLIIETGTDVCSVAYFVGDTLVASCDEHIGRGHAERLLPMIANLPERGRANHILVGLGPGSFTGVRVGVAVARALAMAWEIPVYGYSTMALIARQVFDSNDHIHDVSIVQYGGHGEVFLQSFSASPFLALDAVKSVVPSEIELWQVQKYIAGSGAETINRGHSVEQVFGKRISAQYAYALPVSLKNFDPVPIYGRDADAMPAS